jgi:hypothetical protein
MPPAVAAGAAAAGDAAAKVARATAKQVSLQGRMHTRHARLAAGRNAAMHVCADHARHHGG